MGGLFKPKKRTLEITYIQENVIIVGKDTYHRHDHELQEIKKFFKVIIKNQNKMAKSLAELKAEVEAQSTALDTISGSVTGIQGDIAALKQKIADLSAGADAAVQAALDELTPLVDAVGAKIDTIGATTSALDSENP